jgi:hypothetical protein
VQRLLGVLVARAQTQVGGRAELGMGRRAVVALEVVLEHHLPVGRALVGLRRDLPQALGRVLAQPRRELVDLGADRRGRAVTEAREHQAVPDLERQPVEAERVVINHLAVRHRRRADQTPLEVVGPLVVGAYDPLQPAARLVDHPRAAVAADVQQRGELAFGRAHHEDALADQLADHEVTWLRQLRGVGQVEPVVVPDARHLGLEQRPLDVELARQRCERRRILQECHRRLRLFV